MDMRLNFLQMFLFLKTQLRYGKT